MMERMHFSRFLRIAVFAAAIFLLPLSASAVPFVRGDVDQNGVLDLSDPVNILLYMFTEGHGDLGCLSAADVNDTGAIDLADPIYSLGYLFAGGPPPRPPFPDCGSDPTADDLTCEVFIPCSAQEGELRSEKDRNLAPQVTEGELRELVEGNTAFALDLYGAVRDGKENLFFSPFSISMALAMLYGGARGETEAQMAQALHFTLARERLHAAFNALDLELARRGEGARGRDGEGFRLNIVNAIWGQYDYTFLDAYLDILAENYGAGLRVLDFRSAPEPSRLTINDWVSRKTEGRIPDLLPSGSITSLTRLVLTNAIYFNAAWKTPFVEEATQEGTFHLLDGTAVTVPLMHGEVEGGLASGDGYTAVELPYDGDELSMVIVLPDAGRFESVENSLTGESVRRIIDSLGGGSMNVTMPKFSFRSEFALKGALSTLGMEEAFVPDRADLSGIDGTRALFVSSVIHKAFVAVDEAGTEAAAATGVVVGVTSVPPSVVIDRPFIFFIRDIPTGAVIFIGRVLDPRG